MTCHDAGMCFLDAGGFTADSPWGAVGNAEIDMATVRPRWTDQRYVWHVDDGPEVFMVVGGAVDRYYREHGEERVERLAGSAAPRSAMSTLLTRCRRAGSW